ncbi:MAG: hypothetical protein J5848_01315 [Bacteroidales bacterium]|nr:hypothetical protein [Bacteroidales bacterium]
MSLSLLKPHTAVWGLLIKLADHCLIMLGSLSTLRSDRIGYRASSTKFFVYLQERVAFTC